MKRLAWGVMILVLAAGIGCRRSARTPPGEPVETFFRSRRVTRSEAWGRQLFLARCAACHGDTGRGDGQNAYNLNPPPPDLKRSLGLHPASYHRQVIVNGSVAVGRSALCPPSGRTLSDVDVDALMTYLAVLARPAAK